VSALILAQSPATLRAVITKNAAALRNRVVRAYADGTPVHVIAAHHHLDPLTIHRWARDAGLHVPPRDPRPETLRTEVLAEVTAGSPITKTAAKHGLDEATVTQWATEDGLTVPAGPRSFTEEVKAAAVARYLAGASSSELAADHGVDYRVILRWVTSAGHAIRSRGGANNPTGRSGAA
jgi:transposase-like protein